MAEDLPLTPEDVAEITAILTKSNYDSLDIETARFRLRVARHGDGWTQEWTPAGAAKPAAAIIDAEAKLKSPADDGLLIVKSALPGTFYRAPQPGAPPFVNVGDKVTPDTVVAIIETMKLMNPVHAGVAGEIVAIMPENAEAIDVDTALMKVKT